MSKGSVNPHQSIYEYILSCFTPSFFEMWDSGDWRYETLRPLVQPLLSSTQTTDCKKRYMRPDPKISLTIDVGLYILYY
jgi:hypothetical protein